MNRHAMRPTMKWMMWNWLVILVMVSGAYGQNFFGDDVKTDSGAAAVTVDEAASSQAATLEPAAVEPEKMKPYIGLITAGRVYVRSGPAGIYYPVCYLQKDQQVIVHETLKGKNNWAKIEPTAQCFSYISKDYVKLLEVDLPVEAEGADAPAEEGGPGVGGTSGEGHKPVDPAKLVGKELVIGEVTGNAVRVRAGSMRVKPELATQIQLKLNKGDKVQVIGERDQFYKIVSPKNAYFWVSLDYIKKLDGATEEQFAQVRKLASRDVAMMIEPEKFQSQYDDYLAIAKAYELEQAKTLMMRDYAGIVAKLDAMLKETHSTSIRRSAEGLKRNIERVMTAQMTLKRSRERDHMLMLKMQQIDNELQAVVGSEAPLVNQDKDLTVKGVLTHSAVFTKPNANRRYLVINDMEKIECYAVSNSDMIDLEDWVNRRVFLKGDIKYDSFSQSRILYVDQVEEVKPMPVAPVVPVTVETEEPKG